jgi:hypothetical protein
MIGKKIIYGCQSRGDGDSPYLTRYTLLSTPMFQICLHVFHRSDADDLHDHPWPFASLILWRGYIEETANPKLASLDRSCAVSGMVNWCHKNDCNDYRRIWPGQIIFRSAAHTHRIELIGGKPAVTLVVMGRKVRSWGLFTDAGWEHWKSYFLRRGC